MPLSGKLGPKLKMNAPLFYLWDDGKGKGLEWHKFNVTAHKVKYVTGADGHVRQARNLHRVMKGKKGSAQRLLPGAWALSCVIPA